MAKRKPSNAPITSRQAKWVYAILDLHEKNGRCPTYRELADVFGLKSTNGVAFHLESLEAKGVLVFGRTMGDGTRAKRSMVLVAPKIAQPV